MTHALFESDKKKNQYHSACNRLLSFKLKLVGFKILYIEYDMEFVLI